MDFVSKEEFEKLQAQLVAKDEELTSVKCKLTENHDEKQINEGQCDNSCGISWYGS